MCPYKDCTHVYSNQWETTHYELRIAKDFQHALWRIDSNGNVAEFTFDTSPKALRIMASDVEQIEGKWAINQDSGRYGDSWKNMHPIEEGMSPSLDKRITFWAGRTGGFCSYDTHWNVGFFQDLASDSPTNRLLFRVDDREKFIPQLVELLQFVKQLVDRDASLSAPKKCESTTASSTQVAGES